MKRLNLPLVFDTLFAAVCAFLLFFTAIRFYTKSAAAGLVFGISAFLLCGTLSYLYISRKQNKKLLLSRDEKNKKLLALHLSLSSDGSLAALFLPCFGKEAEARANRITCGGAAHYLVFKMQPLTEDDVALVIKDGFDGDKTLYCTGLLPEACALAESFAIKYVRIDEVYALLKEKRLLPEKYVYEGRQKIKLSKKIRARFTKKLCAPLFWSGAALLALSYFTFFPLYYIISGGVMLFLSAAALIFG